MYNLIAEANKAMRIKTTPLDELVRNYLRDNVSVCIDDYLHLAAALRDVTVRNEDLWEDILMMTNNMPSAEFIRCVCFL